MLDTSIRKSYRVGTITYTSSIIRLCSLEVGTRVVISYIVLVGVGRDLIRIHLSSMDSMTYNTMTYSSNKSTSSYNTMTYSSNKSTSSYNTMTYSSNKSMSSQSTQSSTDHTMTQSTQSSP